MTDPSRHPASLDSFLKPASIAVIGASPDETKLRGRLTHFIPGKGYAGRFYPVTRSHAEIGGRRCYGSIGEVPEPVDLAIIVVPAEHVVDAVRQCAAHGARHVLIMSSGFAEEGGAQGDAQEEIAAIARAAGMRLCGPNAEGFHNEIEPLAATFSPAVDLKHETLAIAGARRVGVIAQSGGIGFALYHRGRALGLAFSRVVTVGNEADLTAADFLAHMVDDRETAAILMFLETIRHPAAFVAAAERAVAARKPIVVVKVGRSAAGGRAAASHTGAMAGWDAAYDAVFRGCGVIVADDLDRALAIVTVMTTCPRPAGNRAAVMTVSGGGGALVADALVAAGLALPVLAAGTQATIKSLIPSYGTAQNPVDVTGQATRTGAPLRVIQMLEAGDEVDIIVAVTTMSNETRTPVDTAALAELVKAQRKPILFFTYTVASQFGLKGLAGAGSPTFLALSDLAGALKELVRYAQFRLPPRAALPPRAPRLAAGPGIVAEHAAKALLERAGIAMPPRRLVARAEDLEVAGAALGYPLAAKIQSADLPHKTEAGGVRLGIADAAALRAAWDDIRAKVRARAPQARIDGVLLEPMAKRGVEVIVGIVRDPTFGPILTLGAGGVATELFRDVSRRPAPVEEAEAEAMLLELKSFPLLDGYRGAPRADIGALARLAAALSRFAAAHADLHEVELNPVIVHATGEGCTVADAMLVVGSEAAA